jgi:uncharacterized protein (TIGR03083 family)
MRDVLLDALVDDVGTIGRALAAHADAPVPSCPGWTVADLVRHHGDVHRWAAEIVRTGEAVADDGHRGPDDVDELATWYANGAADLVGVLRRTDPQRDCWTFGRPPAKSWFWTRRQALEAAIHRWDAQQAGGDADGFPSEVAAAGITEVVDDLYPRQVALGRCAPLSYPVELVATDLDRTWTLGDDTSGRSVDARIAGPAGALFLLLWRRTDLGDPALSTSLPPELAHALGVAALAP